MSAPAWFEAARAAPRRARYVLSIVAALLGALALAHGTGLSLSGNAVAYAEAIHHSVGPLSAGRVEALLVRVGQHVSAGEAIAVLDGRVLRARREKALAELGELQAAVAAAGQDIELKVTRNELRLLEKRADERGTRAALAEVNERMQRLDALLDEQMIEAGRAELARERQSQLAARIGAYDEAKQLGQVGLAPNASLREHVRSVQLHVEPARQAVLVPKASLQQLELKLELTAELPETLAARVEIGQTVSVRVRGGLARGLRGRVVELAPEVAELPVRARPSPAIAAWGRRATLQLDQDAKILPGQAFNVSLD